MPTGASLALEEEEEGEREEEGWEEEEDVPPTTADRRGKCYLINRLAEVDQLSAFITDRIELGAHDCRKQRHAAIMELWWDHHNCPLTAA